MKKLFFFDKKRVLFADVDKIVVGGRTLIQIKVDTNIKIVSASDGILLDIYFDSVNEKYIHRVHWGGGANIFHCDYDFYKMFSFNLN